VNIHVTKPRGESGTYSYPSPQVTTLSPRQSFSEWPDGKRGGCKASSMLLEEGRRLLKSNVESSSWGAGS